MWVMAQKHARAGEKGHQGFGLFCPKFVLPQVQKNQRTTEAETCHKKGHKDGKDKPTKACSVHIQL